MLLAIGPLFGRRNESDLCRTLKDIEAKRWLNDSTVKDNRYESTRYTQYNRRQS